MNGRFFFFLNFGAIDTILAPFFEEKNCSGHEDFSVLGVFNCKYFFERKMYKLYFFKVEFSSKFS